MTTCGNCCTRKAKEKLIKKYVLSKKARGPSLRNNVALVLDDSGSMANVHQKAQQIFNKWIADIKSEAALKAQETNVTLVYFGRDVKVKYAHSPVKHLQPIDNYSPRQSSTALFDGVTRAIEELGGVAPLKKYDDSFLVIVVTDGEENSSHSHNIISIAQKIKDKQGEGNWTFVFVLPPQARNDFCQRYDIPTDNVIEWEQTEASMHNVEVMTTSGIASYYNSRASGARSVCKFFVQPNLSQVKPTEIERKLDDVSSFCHQFTLAKEEVIKDFVEKKTKRPYVIGTAYYQLMKNEKVQSGKSVLLVEKGKSQVWSGPQARSLIGLPANAEARVEPGNHANYDIYIQSNSVNRKLPRGTKLIVVDHIVV